MIAAWRVEEAIAGRHYDDDGCPVENYGGRWLPTPRRFSMAKLMMAIPELADQFRKRVPPDFVNEDVEVGTHLAQVDCPCGEKPIVELGTARGCACDRHFYYAGAPGVRGRRAVFVGRFPDPETEQEHP